MNLAPYSKLVASVVGLLAMLLGPELLNLTDKPEVITQAILGLLTAFGVYRVPNAPLPSASNTPEAK